MDRAGHAFVIKNNHLMVLLNLEGEAL